MKIVVTGGAGFIGSHIVDEFIRIGHTVVVIDNLMTGRKQFVNPKATFYEVDITDKMAVQQVFEKEKPDVLNHHAAQMDVRKSVADPVFDANINIIGLLNLMEAARTNGLKKVIFASSGGAVYGDTAILPTPETVAPFPASPYGVSKLSSEYYLHFYSQAYKIPYVALRYGNVYGPRQNPHGEAGVVAIFTKKLLAQESPIIYGDGEQSRDFVFVHDVVDANVKALEYENSLYVNIGTGVATSVNMVYQTLLSLTKSTDSASHVDAKVGEQRQSLLDATQAHKKLNWRPRISLETGLQQTVEYFRHETKN